MLRATDYCKEYKNGNITIKLDPAAIEELKEDETFYISEILFWMDCSFIGETYCLSNYETGHTIYNCYSDLIYVFPWSALEDLKSGKMIRLYARQPDEWDREILEREGF